MNPIGQTQTSNLQLQHAKNKKQQRIKKPEDKQHKQKTEDKQHNNISPVLPIYVKPG